MTEPLIKLDIHEHIATLTLNRPTKLNALTMEMLDAIETLLTRIDRDPACRVLLLTAAGDKAFCAGADIHAWSALEPLGMWREWTRRGQQIFDRIAGLRQPTIAVIQGIAYGGGLELALACDLRLASDNVRFAFPEVTLGTIPGWGGSRRLPQLIGTARAKQMVFSGAPIDADTALRWGIINEALAAGELKARTEELARQIAANAPLAVQTAKQLMANDNQSIGNALESLASAVTTASEDAKEGSRAFRERRSAQFNNR